VIHEDLTRTGQTRAARVAVEEADPQFSFQFLYRPRKWRLLNVKLLSGSSEVQFLSDRQKAPKVPQFHGFP
jgi:hypothetical protein